MQANVTQPSLAVKRGYTAAEHFVLNTTPLGPIANVIATLNAFS